MRRGCFDCADELVGLWKELEVIWKKTHQTGAKKHLINIKRNPALNDHGPVNILNIFIIVISTVSMRAGFVMAVFYLHPLGQCLRYGNKPAHTVELAAHTVGSLLFWCFVWAGAGVPAEALVWTAGPSDPSSLLLNWF